MPAFSERGTQDNKTNTARKQQDKRKEEPETKRAGFHVTEVNSIALDLKVNCSMHASC